MLVFACRRRLGAGSAHCGVVCVCESACIGAVSVLREKMEASVQGAASGLGEDDDGGDEDGGGADEECKSSSEERKEE